MKDLSQQSLIELAKIMQDLQSGKVVLSFDQREKLLSEIESRVQRSKRMAPADARTVGTEPVNAVR